MGTRLKKHIILYNICHFKAKERCKQLTGCGWCRSWCSSYTLFIIVSCDRRSKKCLACMNNQRTTPLFIKGQA